MELKIKSDGIILGILAVTALSVISISLLKKTRGTKEKDILFI
jgi:hypothetical protein